MLALCKENRQVSGQSRDRIKSRIRKGMAAHGLEGSLAHLHNLGLFLEIRMKVVVALLHPLMLARRRKPPRGGTTWDTFHDNAVYDNERVSLRSLSVNIPVWSSFRICGQP